MRQLSPLLLLLLIGVAGCESKDSDALAAHPGKDIYFKYCGTCHGPGVADAPKFGVREEWEESIAKGPDALLKSTIDGIPPGMPIRGLCMRCSDQELTEAIDYMLKAVETE